MTNRMAWALSASLLTATVMFTPGSSSYAQERSITTSITDFSAQEKKEAPKRAAPAARIQPRVTTPRVVTQHRATPRVTKQPTTTPGVAKQPQHLPKVAGSKTRLPKTGLPKTGLPKTGLPKTGLPKTGLPKTGIPKTGTPKVASPGVAPRNVTPRSRAVVAGRFRNLPGHGVGRTFIHGHNYSAWRGGYRFRHGGGWRTFVGLSILGAIIVGSDNYYPYAYISAPQNYCDGLSEDGCQMMWQPVQTIEGDVVDQCVAYCPWQ